ncbi:MAG: hypothetical protein EOO53_12945 [Gammaproteobacteria bacterium]|nr:MAG: hypothetical protein EOO53_12945 [Gammaproteobacteria bacterium]
MNNIEIFKAISALTLSQAYENFPLKIDISPSDLAITLDDEYWDESLKEISENMSEVVRNKNPASIAKPTIEWLSSSGFITYTGYSDGVFKGVCLTVKGIESIESDNQRGNKLLLAVKELAIEELKTQAKVKLKVLFSEVLSWSLEKYPTIIQAVGNYSSS